MCLLWSGQVNPTLYRSPEPASRILERMGLTLEAQTRPSQGEVTVGGGKDAEPNGLQPNPESHHEPTATEIVTTDFKGGGTPMSDGIAAEESDSVTRWTEGMAIEAAEPEGITALGRYGTSKRVVESPVAGDRDQQDERGTDGMANGVEKINPGERRQTKETKEKGVSCREDRTLLRVPECAEMNTEPPGESQLQQEQHTHAAESDDLREESIPYLWVQEKHTEEPPRDHSPDSGLLHRLDGGILLDTRTVRKLDQVWRSGSQALSNRVRLAERREELKAQRSALRDSIADLMRALGEVVAKVKGTSGDLTTLYQAVLRHTDILGPAEESYDEFEDRVNQADYKLRRQEKQLHADISVLLRDGGASPGVPVTAGITGSDSSRSSDSDDGPKLHPLKYAYLSKVGDANVNRERLSDLDHSYMQVLEEEKIRKPYNIELSKEHIDLLKAYPSDRAQLEAEARDLETAVEELRQKCIEEGLIELGPPLLLLPAPPPPPPPPPLSQLLPPPPPPQPQQQPPIPLFSPPPPPPPLSQPLLQTSPPPQPQQQLPPLWRQPQLEQVVGREPADVLLPPREAPQTTVADNDKLSSQPPQQLGHTSQHGSQLITSFTSTRDRVNRWLLDILCDSPIEIHRYRSILANYSSVSNLQADSLFALLVRYWPTDSAAIGESLSPIASRAASQHSSVAIPASGNTTTPEQLSTAFYAQPIGFGRGGGGGGGGTAPPEQASDIHETRPPLQLVSDGTALLPSTDPAGERFSNSHFSFQVVHSAGEIYASSYLEDNLDLSPDSDLGSPYHYERGSRTPGVDHPPLSGVSGAMTDSCRPPEQFIQHRDSGFSPHEPSSPWSSSASWVTCKTWPR